MLARMMQCQQFDGMSVYQHGVNVHVWFSELYAHLFEGKALTLPWRLPAWIHDPKLRSLPSFEILREYQLWHDIGKPFCREVDEEGRQHFLDHAEVSYQTWISHSDPTPDNELVGELIRKDMLAHTVKGEAAQEFLKDPLAPALLLTALAEVHSNASHMGRLDTDGFRIKLKQLEKLGKKLVM